ncbi:MAG: hypothetical protein K1Y36_02155 [Blastocatellia bacterium]|nr:hypothetical protein [Blastocatellia bacterium]
MLPFANEPMPVSAEVYLPTPRPIRRRSGRGWFLGLIHLFTLPHLLVGVGVATFALYAWLFVLVGTVVPGQVSDKKEFYNQKKHTTTYRLSYTYARNGVQQQGDDWVSKRLYTQTEAGQTVQVKISPLAIIPMSVVVDPYNQSEMAVFPIFLTIFAVFWNGIMTFFWWTLYLRPWLYRWLVKNGKATQGMITKKDIKKSKTTTYLIEYQFQLFAYGQPLTGKMEVRKEDWDHLQANTPVTVLYHPDKPKRNVVYECADYEVAP